MNKPVLPSDTQPADDAPPPMGHNAMPPYDVEQLAELIAIADEFLKGADIWRTTEVTNETLAQQLTDMIAGLRANAKAVDAARVAAKKPHDEASKAVQAAFTPLLDRYKRAQDVLLAKANAYLAKKQAEERERQRIEKEKAEALAAEARMKAMEAEQSGSIDAQLEAEAAQKEAEKAQKEASKDVKVNIGSASGAGRTISTRTRKVATIANINQVFMHFRDNPKVSECLLALANAEANAKDFAGSIPGCTIEEKQVAV